MAAAQAIFNLSVVFWTTFSDLTQPRPVVSCDPWYRLHPDWFWAEDDKSTITPPINILEAIRPEIEQKKLEVCVDYATELLGRQDDFSLDWIYIDTAHTYKKTMAQVLLARHMVKPGGFIMGDDYYVTKIMRIVAFARPYVS